MKNVTTVAALPSQRSATPTTAPTRGIPTMPACEGRTKALATITASGSRCRLCRLVLVASMISLDTVGPAAIIARSMSANSRQYPKARGWACAQTYR